MTIYKAALESATEGKLNDPAWSAVILKAMNGLRSGAYSQSYVECLFQKFAAEPPVTLEDAYGFSLVHYWIASGQVVTTGIRVGSEPANDANSIENNRRLEKITRAPLCSKEQPAHVQFRAEFWGGTQDEDGFISWDKPIMGYRYITHGWHPIEPRKIALEVGYTSIAKTIFQIGQGNGLARWPYGHEEITLFLPITYPVLGFESRD